MLAGGESAGVWVEEEGAVSCADFGRPIGGPLGEWSTAINICIFSRLSGRKI